MNSDLLDVVSEDVLTSCFRSILFSIKLSQVGNFSAKVEEILVNASIEDKFT